MIHHLVYPHNLCLPRNFPSTRVLSGVHLVVRLPVRLHRPLQRSYRLDHDHLGHLCWRTLNLPFHHELRRQKYLHGHQRHLLGCLP